MYGSAAKKYMNVNTLTASRGQLLIALYDTAIRYAKQGAASIKNGDVVAKGKELQRVAAIISELTANLDRSVSVEICDNLERLYAYMQERLAQANALLDAGAAEEVARLLDTLREGWLQAIAETEGQSMITPQTQSASAALR